MSTKTINFSSEAIPKIHILEMPSPNCLQVCTGKGKCSVGFVLVQKAQKQKFDKSKLHFMTLDFSDFQTNSRLFNASIY